MSYSFGFQGESSLFELIAPCKVAPCVLPGAEPGYVVPFAEFRAVWDTGSTGSAVSARLVERFPGMKPHRVTLVHDANASRKCDTYLVNLQLPSGKFFYNHPVSRHNLYGTADVLIGMDIICQGDFAITNKDGKTLWTFQHPTTASIDFRKGQPPFGGGRRLDDF